jgi:hypothetical protein
MWARYRRFWPRSGRVVPADLHHALVSVDVEPGRDHMGASLAIGGAQPADALLFQVGDFLVGEYAHEFLQ